MLGKNDEPVGRHDSLPGGPVTTAESPIWWNTAWGTMEAAGNPKQAFQELSAVQSRLSGMPEFDYLLGVSALDSGRIDDAIIAFERVLAIVGE